MTATTTLPLVDIDVGGTWLRTRVVLGQGADPAETVVPAPSRLHEPERPVAELIDDLLDHLDRAAPHGSSVAVSLGAAMDESTGVVHGSGPLWGDFQGPLPVRELLEARRPDVAWHIYNDLTCGVAALAEQAPAWARQVTYVTVSSGVALRTADLERGVVDVDRWGMQGEVGHGSAAPQHPSLTEHGPLPCDCGGSGHVAALASGPGLARAAELMGLGPADGFARRFTGLLDEDDPRAHILLAEAVRPIAETIRTLWRMRPHAELVGIGGGVATSLGDRYQVELHRQLVTDRAYSDLGRDHEWVADRVRVLRPGQCDVLAGARLIAQGYLLPRPPTP